MTRRLLVVCLVAILAGPLSATEPTWAAILNCSGCGTEASGTYTVANHGWATPVTGTYLGVYSVFNVPLDQYGNPQTVGGYDTGCSSVYRYPQQTIRSNYGPGVGQGTYKGVEALATFGSGSTGSGSGILHQAIFFHEDTCYNGGREYGFDYNARTGQLTAFWNTNANLGSEVRQDVNVGNANQFADAQYWFVIWPESTGGGSCQFKVVVRNTSYGNEWGPNTFTDGISSITSVDSNFCSSILDEHGYVTATTLYVPTISSIATSTIKLTTPDIRVGK